MQLVSEEWKANHQQTLANESFVEVTLDMADPDALADASCEDNGAIYISNTPQVVSEVDISAVPYSTLEQNMWVLDGSRKPVPSTDYNNNGYIGDMLSDERGTFSERSPVLNVLFTREHLNLIPAVTITWSTAYNEFAEDFSVAAYSGTKLVAKKEVQQNKSVKSVVMMDISNYDKIVITVHRWCLPHRRARVEEVFVGMRKIYTKSDIFSYSHSQTADPIAASLPKSEISFSINNVDGDYNPYNPLGMSKYLMERQEVKSRYGVKYDDGRIEWIKGGTFYLSEWDAPQNGLTADFTARDLLEFMSTVYYGGIYSPEGIDLYTLAVKMLEEADLPLNSDGSVKWEVDEILKTIYTTAPLPIDTIANNLQLIANAAGCILYQNRNGILRIKPIELALVGVARVGMLVLGARKPDEYSINLDNSYSKSTISLEKPVKDVKVAVYNYFKEGEVELYKGDIYINGTTEILLTYSEEAADVVATVEGGTLNSAEYYTRACKLNITGNGTVSVVINGVKLNEAKSEVTAALTGKGDSIVIDNPLITNLESAYSLGEWMSSYIARRTKLSSSWRADPRLDVLDIIENKNEYNTNSVIMTDVKFTYNGAFRGTAEGKVI